MKMKTCQACPDSGQSCPGVRRNLALISFFQIAVGAGHQVRRKQALGFTLVEVVVATFVGAIMMLALHICFVGGFAILKVTREDLRATQIALEQMEAIRLAPYAALKDPTKFPTTSTVYFDEKGKSVGKGGVPYTVTFKAEALPSPKPQSSYFVNMMQITVGVSWKSGNITRQRTLQTYAAKFGIQGYVGASN
jgi:Tfp pilus assembly protein PilV